MKLLAGCTVHKILSKFMNRTLTAELSPAQAAKCLEHEFVEKVGASYRLTVAGEREYEAYLSTLPNQAKPSKPDIWSKTYDGAELTNPPARAGATDALKCPSRRGNTLVYRNEKLPILSMGSMTDFIEPRGKR
jgi:hypothetical protein